MLSKRNWPVQIPHEAPQHSHTWREVGTEKIFFGQEEQHGVSGHASQPFSLFVALKGLAGPNQSFSVELSNAQLRGATSSCPNKFGLKLSGS